MHSTDIKGDESIAFFPPFQPPPQSLPIMASVDELASKYSEQLGQLQAIFPSWDESDLAFTLQDARGNVDEAAMMITEGGPFISRRKGYADHVKVVLPNSPKPRAGRRPPNPRNRPRGTRTGMLIRVDGRRSMEVMASSRAAGAVEAVGEDAEVAVDVVEVSLSRPVLAVTCKRA